MATRAYNKTLVLDASFTLIKSSTDSRLGQLDTSANSFTSRLGSHDTSIAKLDASATSFTTRLGNHDLILDKLDASGTNYKVRIDKLDASANTYTARLAVLDSSFNSLTLQSLFNNSTWDEDVSGAIVKLDVSSTYIINNFYDKHATEQLLDGSLNSLKSLYIDPSVNTLKTYTDLSLNELKSFIEGHYYTSIRTDASFANVLIVGSHTTSLNKLDASATSFTSRLGQLDTSVNIVEGAITSQYSQISALQVSTGKLDASMSYLNGNGWNMYNPVLDVSGSSEGQEVPTADVSGGWYRAIGKTLTVHANFTITTDGSGIYSITLPTNLQGQYAYINSTVIIEAVDGNIYTGVVRPVFQNNSLVNVLVGSSPATFLTHEHASIGVGSKLFVNLQYQIV